MPPVAPKEWLPERRRFPDPTEATQPQDLTDPDVIARLVESQMPMTTFVPLITAIWELGGKQLTPAALQTFVVTVGQRLRGGAYGNMKLVIATPDDAVRETIALLAREHQLPLFVSRSADPVDVYEASAAGDLTETERQTLEQLRRLGGSATVAELAEALALEPSAAHNRLANVEGKGFLFRVERGRREGDLFVDPRTPADPYGRSTLTLEGEAGERAAELIRARHRQPPSG
jgi:DNA-binding MarR family transcriptional regulator